MLSAFAMNYLLLAQEVGLSLAAKNFACKFQNLFYRLCCYGYLLLACKGLFTYTTQNLIIPFAENLKDSNVSSDQLSEPLLFILCCWIFAKIRLNIL